MRTLLILAFLASTLPRASAACACCVAPVPAAASTDSSAPAPAEGPASRHAGITVGGCYGKPEPQPAPAEPAPVPAPAPAAVGHPVKGVIVEILAAKSALLVKHEEIPGVMGAMTMLLKVDAPTLAAAKKGQAITATLVKKTDGWWLEAVTPVAPGQ